MKIALYLIAAALFATSATNASILVSLDNPSQTGTLDNPDQTGNPGFDFIYSGTIVNNGSETVYLDGDSLIFNNNGDSVNFTINDNFANLPLSLDPNQSTGDVELFDIMISQSFAATFGSYSGTYSLSGDPDGTQSAEQLNEPVSFSVDVEPAVPEPGSLSLLVMAGVAFSVAQMAGRRRRHI